MKTRLKERLKTGGTKVIGSAMSVVLAVGLMPMPAFAGNLEAASLDLTTQAITYDGAKSDSGLIIGAAHAAANPAPETLGLSNPACRNENEITSAGIFFGDPEVNESVDPYMYNSMHNIENPTATKYTPAMTVNSWTGSPAGAMNAYNTSKADAESNIVWQQRPQIFLGTGKSTDDWTMYDSANYARAAETANKWTANSYHPLAAEYTFTALSSMTKSLYKMAECAELVIKGDDYKPGQYGISEDDLGNLSYGDYKQDLKARYEDPIEIAKDYERYILGQKGAVLSAIEQGTVKKKTIALVSSYSDNTYQIQTEGYSTGTETTNRYLEAVQGVTNNLYDKYSSGTVTKAQLNEADFIVLSGGSDSNTVVTALTADGLTTAPRTRRTSVAFFRASTLRCSTSPT